MRQESAISSLAKPGYFVPESKHIGELFSEMQAEGKQVAIVVDEFGGIDGLVTMNQLAEEAMGYFSDEFARRHKTYDAINEHSYVIDGGMRVDQANEDLGLQLPKVRYETVAGFVLEMLGHIPEKGEQARYEQLILTIKEMNGTKIDKILITEDIDTEAQD